MDTAKIAMVRKRYWYALLKNKSASMTQSFQSTTLFNHQTVLGLKLYKIQWYAIYIKIYQEKI